MRTRFTSARLAQGCHLAPPPHPKISTATLALAIFLAEVGADAMHHFWAIRPTGLPMTITAVLPRSVAIKACSKRAASSRRGLRSLVGAAGSLVKLVLLL
jgi:hypothetical protein